MTEVVAKPAREFTVRLDDVEYPVAVEGGDDQGWEIIVNGRSFTVKLGENGRVLVDGIAYDVFVDDETVTADDASYALEVSGLSLSGAGSRAPAVSGPPAQAHGGAGAVVAVMPGQVTRVLVAEGQEVEENEPVCVLEAMKMENELRADRGGVVRAVHVQPGQDVEKGRVLVEIE